VSSYLVDTSILVRLMVSHDPLRPTAKTAIGQLRGQAVAMSVAAQCVIELWAVSTRPLTANGLGLSTEQRPRRSTRC